MSPRDMGSLELFERASECGDLERILEGHPRLCRGLRRPRHKRFRKARCERPELADPVNGVGCLDLMDLYVVHPVPSRSSWPGYCYMESVSEPCFLTF